MAQIANRIVMCFFGSAIGRRISPNASRTDLATRHSRASPLPSIAPDTSMPPVALVEAATAEDSASAPAALSLPRLPMANGMAPVPHEEDGLAVATTAAEKPAHGHEHGHVHGHDHDHEHANGHGPTVNGHAPARWPKPELETDARYMWAAVEQARLSKPVMTGYCVGAVLVHNPTGEIRATGYSRELPDNTHAEECCLIKIAGFDETVDLSGVACTLDLHDYTLYTTMEPCSLRLSGKRACVTWLLAAKLGRVVVGIREPPNFVPECQGMAQLQAAGIATDVCAVYEAECRAVNAHLLSP